MQITYLFLLLLCCAPRAQGWPFSFMEPTKSFVLMIEAGADSIHPGRIINDSFENDITFEIAQTLKNKLHERVPWAKIILNRTPEETVKPLQNANFANKLNVDCYISIHAFAQTETKPRIFIYQFSYHDTIIAKEGLGFYPFDKIYLAKQPQTTQWAHTIKESLANNQSLTIKGVYAIPFRPLIGIKAPAIGLELGLKNRSSWVDCIEALVESLAPIING